MEHRKLNPVRVLLTAFEPYDHWTTNSSWLAVVELLKDFPSGGSLVTRRYPVDLPALQEKLKQDLQRDFDVVLHLGQAPGASSIKLEAIALNAAGCLDERGVELNEIIPGGPVAYRSNLPLGRWATLLRATTSRRSFRITRVRFCATRSCICHITKYSFAPRRCTSRFAWLGSCIYP